MPSGDIEKSEGFDMSSKKNSLIYYNKVIKRSFFISCF